MLSDQIFTPMALAQDEPFELHISKIDFVDGERPGTLLDIHISDEDIKKNRE